MQVVIEIPEELYKKQLGDSWTGNIVIHDAIVNGTPLPKGYGRIGDFDAALECIKECQGEDAIYAVSLIEWACKKRTIIPAERSDTE